MNVLSPTVEELFEELEVHGSFTLTENLLANSLMNVATASSSSGPRPKKFIGPYLSTYTGALGVKVEWSYELPCQTGGSKFDLVNVTLGVYGDIKVDISKSRIQDVFNVSAAYVVPTVDVKIGCKVSWTDRGKIASARCLTQAPNPGLNRTGTLNRFY